MNTKYCRDEMKSIRIVDLSQKASLGLNTKEQKTLTSSFHHLQVLTSALDASGTVDQRDRSLPERG